MRDRLDIICCDAPDCPRQVSGPATYLNRQARDEGWQVNAVTEAWATDDGPELHRTDRCPSHPVEVIPDEVILRELGGPGGIQPRHLRD